MAVFCLTAYEPLRFLIPIYKTLPVFCFPVPLKHTRWDTFVSPITRCCHLLILQSLPFIWERPHTWIDVFLSNIFFWHSWGSQNPFCQVSYILASQYLNFLTLQISSTSYPLASNITVTSPSKSLFKAFTLSINFCPSQWLIYLLNSSHFSLLQRQWFSTFFISWNTKINC